MEEVSIIGIDLAKRSFQVHGARADGSVAFRRKLSRGRLLKFLASQPGCTVAMEACASARYWGREIAALGHEVRLVPPIYVKPFVKEAEERRGGTGDDPVLPAPMADLAALKVLGIDGNPGLCTPNSPRLLAWLAKLNVQPPPHCL